MTAPRRPAVTPTSGTSLYRHFDAEGQLLYVGISLSVVSRLAQHRDGSPWYDQIAMVTVERFPTRGDAHAAERAAIRAEKPRHNHIRYTESVQRPPGKSVVGTPVSMLGSVAPSPPSQERERIIDALCCPPAHFDTLEGIAACLGRKLDGIRPFVVLPCGADTLTTYSDLVVLADRACRGTLETEEPWVLGAEPSVVVGASSARLADAGRRWAQYPRSLADQVPA